MSQREGFTNGFLAGTLLGGLVGGILGAALIARGRREPEELENRPILEENPGTRSSPEESMELARRNLEEKIARLNLAIDDVRQQLGTVNENGIDRG
jgi:Na+/glutamate symporter